MCAIFGSFKLDKLKELYELNRYRGELAYSLACFQFNGERIRNKFLWGGRTSFPDDTWDLLKDVKGYYVAHIQAPTTDTEEVQPSVFHNTLLWHNGIVKQKELEENEWDTRTLHKGFLKYGESFLSDVDGTFACVYHSGSSLYVFRNEISPLFYDDEMNISSTEFEGSKSLPPNHLFDMNIYMHQIRSIGEFTTKENPYFIAE